MKSIRIGNDIRIEWPVMLGDGVPKLKNVDVSVYVRPSSPTVDWHNYTEHPTIVCEERTVMGNGGMERWHPGCGKERPRPRHYAAGAPVRLPLRVDDDKITAWWRADRQFALGEYDIVLYVRKNEAGQAVCDQCRFVRLVAHSAQADLPDDSGIEAVIALQPLTLEMSGLSAYDIAVEHGFEGTEEEWLASLKPDAELREAITKEAEAREQGDAALQKAVDGLETGVDDYREKFVETGINDTMPRDMVTGIHRVWAREDRVTLEVEAMHRGSSDGYQPNDFEADLPAATATTAGVMSASDKAKLDGLTDGIDDKLAELAKKDAELLGMIKGLELAAECGCEAITDEEIDEICGNTGESGESGGECLCTCEAIPQEELLEILLE